MRRFEINGIDNSGHAFQRLSSTARTSYVPEKPVVNVDQKLIELKSNISAEIQCHVQSQLPYRVDWFRNGELVSSAAYASELRFASAAFDPLLFLFLFRAQTNTIVHSIDHPREAFDEGVYLCNVTSKSGFDSGEMIVDVLGNAH